MTQGALVAAASHPLTWRRGGPAGGHRWHLPTGRGDGGAGDRGSAWACSGAGSLRREGKDPELEAEETGLLLRSPRSPPPTPRGLP